MVSSTVKRAYHKMSLKVHPDRVPEKEKKTATERFQVLGKVYSILSDEESRKVYDETGILKILLFIKILYFKIFISFES